MKSDHLSLSRSTYRTKRPTSATPIMPLFFFTAFLLIFLIMTLSACSNQAQPSSESTPNTTVHDVRTPIHITTTTSMITDLVEQIGKEHVEVIGLMGPGVDPHLYKASQSDLNKLKNADLIFYNGLSLEGKMSDIFVKMAREKPTIAVSEYIPDDELREPEEFEGHYDPHIWFDVSLWIKAAERVRDALIEYDPAHKDDYVKNATAYIDALTALDNEVREKVQSIPETSRVLITSHDAFGYFGKRYGIEVRGLQGISTDAEIGVKDVQDLVNFILDRHVKAIFLENIVPERSIQSVIEGVRGRGGQLEIGGELLSDALNAPGQPGDTYIGMIRYNVDTIVRALK